MKQGILLLNLGTPDDLSISSIRSYLSEFLLDPRVVDIPAILRYCLVYGIIVPFRAKKSYAAYKAIWTDRGSPLKVYTQELSNALAEQLGDAYIIKYAMRYANPSIQNILSEFTNISELIIVPLFPQYSSAASGSAIAKTLDVLSSYKKIPNIRVINQFYNHQSFINCYSKLLQPYINLSADACIMFSYHGLPQRQIDSKYCSKECSENIICPEKNINNNCYRSQCYQTTRLIANKLQLPKHSYTTAFQSRLGRAPWIKPYSDHMLDKLLGQGIKHLVMTCPSFVADCLETLEEINIGLRQQWLQKGGESFVMTPALNTMPLWVSALSDIIVT